MPSGAVQPLAWEVERCAGRRVAEEMVGISATRPHQHAAVLIPGNPVRIEKFVLEGLQGLVVQVKLHFERAIRHPAPLAQQDDHLIYDRDKVHPVSSLHGARPTYSWTSSS